MFDYEKVKPMRNLDSLSSKDFGSRVEVQHDGTTISGILTGWELVDENGMSFDDDDYPDGPVGGVILTVGSWRSGILPVSVPITITS